jgi:hypothetical protein
MKGCDSEDLLTMAVHKSLQRFLVNLRCGSIIVIRLDLKALKPLSQRPAAPTHSPSRHGSPDLEDPNEQLHNLLSVVLSPLDKRTRRAADRHSVKAYMAAARFALGADILSDYASYSAEFHPSRPSGYQT